MNSSLTSVTSGITAGQIKLVTRIIADVADSRQVQAALSSLDKAGAERLKGSPEFATSIRNFVIEQIEVLSVSNQFANEEVSSRYGYLSGYTKPNGITEQTNILRQLIPGVGFANESLTKNPLPAHAEGYLAIPRWQSVAPTYSGAVQVVFDLLKKAYKGKFTNYRDGEINENHIRQSSRTAAWFEKLGVEQKGYDILVVPAQFGLRHAGRSVRRAVEVMFGSEFGLDAWSVGIILLTHANRLAQYDDLWIDCAGTEWSPGGDGVFSYSVYFGWRGGKLEFVSKSLGDAFGIYGSASGFGSQGDS